MKAVQIAKYSKTIQTRLCDIPVPEISDSEVLVRVKAAAVNPLELLILTGSVRLIQDYPMPLTLGNECAGIVEKVGRKVSGFRPGDQVYARLPINKIGAFAEYAAIDQSALAPMPTGYSFAVAAAIPLTGLTAYQGIVEQLEAKPGSTLLIPGGSGSFGQMAFGRKGTGTGCHCDRQCPCTGKHSGTWRRSVHRLSKGKLLGDAVRRRLSAGYAGSW